MFSCCKTPKKDKQKQVLDNEEEEVNNDGEANNDDSKTNVREQPEQCNEPASNPSSDQLEDKTVDQEQEQQQQSTPPPTTTTTEALPPPPAEQPEIEPEPEPNTAEVSTAIVVTTTAAAASFHNQVNSLAESRNSSTSTAPPESMTSAIADENTGVVVEEQQIPTEQQQPHQHASDSTTEPEKATTTCCQQKKAVPTKSCLSRHNSTHQSIKKKVNISTRAEIIEPEPEPDMLILMLPNNQHSNSIADDDEVFSDSLPPPKRENLCAPYIERDLVPETVVFAHGLPAWFDDERLNEIGCIEPPVTPVGRDELELKRQRLYTELLRAAHAAVEHSAVMRNGEHHDNQEGKVPTVAVAQLETLCERLETLVDRLERTLTYPEEPLKKIEQETHHQQQQEQQQPQQPQQQHSTISNMSVNGFQDIIAGPLSQYLALSAKIGGDVAQHAQFVKLAFDAQLHYVTLATQVAQPAQAKQAELLQPTSTQISAIQDYREKHRSSLYFNHLSAISESIPALGWVCVSPTPGPHVKEMNDAGQFYTNRVLKEWKEKDASHVEWARAWIQTLNELQAYIKQYHTTGLVWSGKGAAPAAAAGGVPPPPPPGGLPPPPPPLDLSALQLDSAGDDRSALFAQINQGADITKNLKKVTDDMQTHKNAALRTGPAPFKTPAQYGGSGSSAAAAPAAAKPPVFTRDGKKWLIEYQKNNTGLLVDNAEMNNVVYVFKCENSTLTVKGKVNNIVLDSCKKCSLLFDSVVASVEFVNCQSVQMQVLGFVPTVSIDKTDGCQMYLSKESLGVEIVNSKSSEMNILLPEANGDYTELALPEQYKTTIVGKTLKTVCVDSLG